MTETTSLKNRFLPSVALLTCGVLAGGLFLWTYRPATFSQQAYESINADRAPMEAALSTESLQKELEGLESLSTRSIGSENYAETQAYLAERFEQAGYEVSTQALRSVAPVTRRSQVLDAEGNPLEITCAPLLPNGFQPVATPEEGVTGELILMNEGVLQANRNFNGKIGVIDAAQLLESYQYDWRKYFSLGLSGLILTDSRGLESIDWLTADAGMRSPLPVNALRVVADPEILQYVGERVTLQVNVHYAAIDTPTVLAKLPSAQTHNEALIIASAYDTFSLVPDLTDNQQQDLPLALQLGLAKALTAYRNQLKRDVWFASFGTQSNGHAGEAAFLQAIGPRLARSDAQTQIETQLKLSQERAALLESIQTALNTDGFLETPAGTLAAVQTLDTASRNFLNAEFRYVVSSIAADVNEQQLQASIAMKRAGEDNFQSPQMATFLDAQRAKEEAQGMINFTPERLYSEADDWATDHQVKERFSQRIEQLNAHENFEQQRWQDALTISKHFEKYSNIVVVYPDLVLDDDSAKETVSALLSNDYATVRTNKAGPFKAQIEPISGLIQSVQQRTRNTANFSEIRPNLYFGPGTTHPIPVAAETWNQFSYPALSFVNTERDAAYYEKTLPFSKDTGGLASIDQSTRLLGELVLNLGAGAGQFAQALPVSLNARSFNVSGSTYLSEVGQGIIPNYKANEVVVGTISLRERMQQAPGRMPTLYLMSNPYGNYELFNNTAQFAVTDSTRKGITHTYNPEAALYNKNGQITYFKDIGNQAQGVYKSVNLGPEADKLNTNLVLFRAAPVTIYDQMNPQTLAPWDGVEIIQKSGLKPFEKLNYFDNDGFTQFLPPDEIYYVTFKVAPEKDSPQRVIRAMMLGESEFAIGTTDNVINGKGYLTDEGGVLSNVYAEISDSLERVNLTRLQQQNEFDLVDEQTQTFAAKQAEFSKKAAETQTSFQDRLLNLWDSITYGVIIHPILRFTVSESFISIVWYLGFLVPFTFFFEKLVFCYSDIRKQLAAMGGIFLTVYALLNWFHPAFSMIRSSFVILLGFIIFLISAGIALMFVGRFQENLEQLKKNRAQVKGTNVDKMGVLATSFMLGLNNMHRRKVRTGLTCLTLVLITFAMIAFTSVSTDFQETQNARGPANYQGLLIKNNRFEPVLEERLFGLESRFGDRHDVSPRFFYAGVEDSQTRTSQNPEILVTRPPEDGAQVRRYDATTILMFDSNEPMANAMPMLTEDYWFDQEPEDADLPPVLIADAMAESLGIQASDVAAGKATVNVNGLDFIVRGIFDSQKLTTLRDLDGNDLMPFDITALPSIARSPNDWVELAEDHSPRLTTSGALIMSSDSNIRIGVPNSRKRLNSVALNLNQSSYKEARETIENYLEQSARPAYYGLNDTAYEGMRLRANSVEGLIDLLIPLLIAGMTVLNTMNGSVYERKDELFVYNAVGIAPRYIFFMFIAEAMVYAVVGTVAGYLLSQGVGMALTALDLTGGLNMTFSSINTIYASLAVIVAVFLSTLIPARTATRIAAPSEDVGWKLPDPENDKITFSMPFTFHHRERIAVSAFFERYLADHTEGGSGRFTVSDPELCLEHNPDNVIPHHKLVPVIEATVWLKPFDLGVSQQLRLAFEPIDNTAEYNATVTLTRQTGTTESWTRLNTAFVRGLRKQFLDWRAVGEEERETLFAEAEKQFRKTQFNLSPIHG